MVLAEHHCDLALYVLHLSDLAAIFVMASTFFVRTFSYHLLLKLLFFLLRQLFFFFASLA